MNIFILDYDIERNIQAHCNAHVVKMILESTQLLSSVHHATNPDAKNITCLYKSTHANHPCAVWARSSLQNYEWLFSFTILLGEEYTYRYGKVHASIARVEAMPYPAFLPDTGFTTWPKCVHDDFKQVPDVVEAYRKYYIRDKGYFCKWTGRDVPDWFTYV
jgi:hypothetical protein